MSIKGQNTKSIRKKVLPNTRNPIVGTKNIKFHHETSAGEIIIDLTNLNLPAGFINPSPSEIAKARIKDFKNNLFLISSDKNSLMEGNSLGYEIIDNNTIKLNFEAEAGEIFTGLFVNATINGTLIADVRTPGASGDLLEDQTDFNLGEAIPIDNLSNQWPIQVFRGTDGKPMTRNTGNGTSGGNYQMIDNGDGFCQVIRFNIAGGVGNEGIIWASHGAIGERPNLSVLQQVDNLNGIMDRMKDDLLEVTGFDIEDPTRYTGIPTNADLKAFGDKVQNLEKILNLEVLSEINELGARIANNGTATITSQNGDFIDSVSRDSLGQVTITFKVGAFTVIPAITACSEDNGDANPVISAISTSAVTFQTEIAATGGKEDQDFSINVIKQGVDFTFKKKIRDLI